MARGTASPPAVGAFAEALADWLSSFTVPPELAAEMASACAAGAPWAAALAGTSVRRAGWPEREALAWGIAVGALAGSLEAGRRSLASPPVGSGRSADGPALPLLAADGLIAAAHETLASLDPGRLAEAMDALSGGFGDGGPWKTLDGEGPRPGWPALVAVGLGPAADGDPDGPWAELAGAWREDAGDRRPSLWDHPAADAETKELLREAARAAAEPGEGDDDEGF